MDAAGDGAGVVTALDHDRLSDRVWRQRHPTNRRICRLRRLFMLGTFFAFCVFVGTYLYLTDPVRLRSMASDSLSSLLGSQVNIGQADLSFFEGLTLSDVSIVVGPRESAASSIFTARSLAVQYDLPALLAGRIVPTRIVAINPTLRLAEDVQSHRWNFESLGSESPAPGPAWKLKKAPSTQPASPRQRLPEIVLRDARVEYLETTGQQTRVAGWMSMEGRLAETPREGEYAIDVQTRGPKSIGPSIHGTLLTQSGNAVVTMINCNFGPDVQAMLPSDVRSWCIDHQLAGRLDLDLRYVVAKWPRLRSDFDIKATLNEGSLLLDPAMWTSAEDQAATMRLENTLQKRRYVFPFNPSLIDCWKAELYPEKSRLHNVAGVLDFSNAQIQVRNLVGQIGDNQLVVNGVLKGYSPQSGMDVTISSPVGGKFHLDASDDSFARMLPWPKRVLLRRLDPYGDMRASLHLVRAATGTPVSVDAAFDIIDGNFCFAEFAYPVRHARGQVVIGRDASRGFDVLRLIDLTARGIDGGPNQNKTLQINGWIGPLDNTAGGDVHVWANDIKGEPALRRALPEPARQAIDLFDPHHDGSLPTMNVSFDARASRPAGAAPGWEKWRVDTDVTLNDAKGTFAGFAYPFEHVTGSLQVRRGLMNIIGVQSNRGDALSTINGTARWLDADDLKPGQTLPAEHGPWIDLQVQMNNIPIDSRLIDALPVEVQAGANWAGVSGKISAAGRIFRDRGTDNPADLSARYDLKLNLKDASFWPGHGTFAVSDASGRFHLTNGRVEALEFQAKRGEGRIGAQGVWQEGQVSAHVTASQLALDTSLYRLLPAKARGAWDEIRPSGSIDADVTYDTRLPGTFALEEYGISPATQPGGGLHIKLAPKDLSVNFRDAPYALEHVRGELAMDDTRIAIARLDAQHQGETWHVSGFASQLNGQWDLAILGKKIDLGGDLLPALPASLRDAIKSLKSSGSVDVDLKKLAFALPLGREMAASAPTTQGAQKVEFAGSISSRNANVDVGVWARDMQGTVQFSGSTLDSHLQDINAEAAIQSMTIAGLSAKDFHALAIKKPDAEEIDLTRIGASVAGGDVGGELKLGADHSGQSHYNLSLLLRDADVKEFAVKPSADIDGRLSASLDMSGDWNKSSARQGRGQVLVSGKRMYQIPLILGLFQVTNLSLPISGPFEQGSARYSLEGQRVIVDQLELRNKDMSMQGTGHLDFDTRKVDLRLQTANPNWPMMPIVGQIWRGATDALLRVHVTGTLQSPSVSASALDNFTTTIDRVISGNEDK